MKNCEYPEFNPDECAMECINFGVCDIQETRGKHIEGKEVSFKEEEQLEKGLNPAALSYVYEDVTYYYTNEHNLLTEIINSADCLTILSVEDIVDIANGVISTTMEIQDAIDKLVDGGHLDFHYETSEYSLNPSSQFVLRVADDGIDNFEWMNGDEIYPGGGWNDERGIPRRYPYAERI